MAPVTGRLGNTPPAWKYFLFPCVFIANYQQLQGRDWDYCVLLGLVAWFPAAGAGPGSAEGLCNRTCEFPPAGFPTGDVSLPAAPSKAGGLSASLPLGLCTEGFLRLTLAPKLSPRPHFFFFFLQPGV